MPLAINSISNKVHNEVGLQLQSDISEAMVSKVIYQLQSCTIPGESVDIVFGLCSIIAFDVTADKPDNPSVENWIIYTTHKSYRVC
jgi:hypothetical protein